MNPKPFRIIPCSEWGARQPKRPATVVGRPKRAIFHHTAGHAPNLDLDSGESYAEAVAYAVGIQKFHMGRGWNDTGQNFTVTRNGYIFEGRRGSLEAVKKGKMVVSAHCPGQNDQPGVEIEHNGSEPMTPIQREAAVWLFAYLAKQGGFPGDNIYGHKQFFPTGCPGVLYVVLPQFRKDVLAALKTPAAKRADYTLTVEEKDGRVIRSEARWPRRSAAVAAALRRDPRSISLERL